MIDRINIVLRCTKIKIYHTMTINKWKKSLPLINHNENCFFYKEILLANQKQIYQEKM